MSDRSEKDRWNELAELLGLPPDAKPPEAAAPAPPPASPPVETPVSHRNDPSPEFAEAEPQAMDTLESAELMDAAVAEAPLPESTESKDAEPAREEEAEPDQRRGGRRRGRRGQRNDGQDRDHRRRKEQPVAEDNAEVESPDPDRLEHGDAAGNEEFIGRDNLEDEILEPEEASNSEPEPEDQDDEEIDKLTDWSVPSWSELIGSLYRPER